VAQSFVRAIFRNAARHRATWIKEQSVTAAIGIAGMALPIIFPRHQLLTVLAMAGVYGVIAMFLVVRRLCKEANNVFALQEAHIKMLQDDVDTHPGDVTYEVDRGRQHHRKQLQAIAHFREKADAHFERELWRRDERIRQLEATIQQQIAFIDEIQRRDRPSNHA
jgi:hypothetical protein